MYFNLNVTIAHISLVINCISLIQMSNLPFYVLKRQKCVNVRNICPSRMVVGFSGFRQRILQGEGTNSEGVS